MDDHVIVDEAKCDSQVALIEENPSDMKSYSNKLAYKGDFNKKLKNKNDEPICYLM